MEQNNLLSLTACLAALFLFIGGNVANNPTQPSQPESTPAQPELQSFVQCTNIVDPAAGDINVSLASAINWEPADGNPAGYLLMVGTTPGGTDIANLTLGNVTTYDPPGNLPSGTTIYVLVVGFNANGPAMDCEEESFTTESCTPNLVVNSIPVPSGTYRSLGILTSFSSTVANGGNVVFISDTGVLLDDDFTVNLGGVFEAKIEGCD